MSSSFVREFVAVAGHCARSGKEFFSPFVGSFLHQSTSLFSIESIKKTACDVKQMTPIFSRSKTEF